LLSVFFFFPVDLKIRFSTQIHFSIDRTGLTAILLFFNASVLWQFIVIFAPENPGEFFFVCGIV